jgi:hypothetical protein
MSTKTTFKRIALVAVAALGLGVLSVAPSSAAVINLSATTVTTVNGTATTEVSDSTTGATIRVTYTGETNADTVTVTSYVSAQPSGSAAAPAIVVHLVDTATSSAIPTVATLGTGAGAVNTGATSNVRGDSVTAIISANSVATNSVNLEYYFLTASALSAGTYTITSVITPFSAGVRGTSFTKDVNIVVSAVASASRTASAAFSTLGDPSVSTAVATVSATASARATLALVLKNASDNTAARESVTATITGPGTIGDGTVNGKSVVLKYSSTSLTLNVYSDGTAGVSTINVSTPSVTFAPKTVTFYAKSPKTITAAAYSPVLNIGANTLAIAATAVDANGTNWAGALSIKAVAAADALVGGSATAPVACSYNATEKTHFCPITTIAAGTAKFVVVDQSAALGTETAYAAAMSAATSNEVTVTVSTGVPTTVRLAFDKATYQPFEKALITVTPLDASGKTLGSRAITDLLATGGITSNIAFGSQSDTLTAVSRTTEAANGTDKTAGSYTYVVYMPAQGDVTISATGGTGLAAAGQVKVTATATVVNSSVDAATDAANEATDAANAATDAALAAADAADAATAAAQDASDAVAALSASVSKLISSLRAQITSLTNLVIKIQKKVRA